MSDDLEKPESGAGEAKPPKIKAEVNPWYLLATLYGEAGEGDHELRDRNRVAWNRYYAASLGEKIRTKLIEEKRHPAKELRLFSPLELLEAATAFAARCKASGNHFALPASSADIDFFNVEFERDVFFGGYLFSTRATFSGTAFFGDASFGGATFSGGASFYSAVFSTRASFAGAAIFDASFGVAVFSGGAKFDDADFSGWTSFNEATFGGSTSFVNAKIKGETTFEGAIFNKEPPRFFDAKLHQGTVWRGITWPPEPKDRKQAGDFIDAYECLKLEMDRLKKHEDELDFFALELQSRRVLLGPLRGLPFAIYGLLSNYGRSYIRPLLALLAVTAAGAGIFRHFDAQTVGDAFGLSAANTLNVFGFRKDFIDPSVIACLSPWLEVWSAVQTILGTILLFLFGLGIRNKFRMK
jgi:uncharacterized protein YjbI with pentapeptide repeats